MTVVKSKKVTEALLAALLNNQKRTSPARKARRVQISDKERIERIISLVKPFLEYPFGLPKVFVINYSDHFSLVYVILNLSSADEFASPRALKVNNAIQGSAFSAAPLTVSASRGSSPLSSKFLFYQFLHCLIVIFF